VSEESSVGAAVFVVLCGFGYISVVVEECVSVRDCRGFGLCRVGIVGCSVGDENEGGRGSLVSCQGRMGGEGEGWEKRVGRMSCWIGEKWVLAQEKDGE
jgi:hypothetical protein